ncbi:Ribosomal protein L35 [Ostreococcus tauri]|uniref:50S ribosomal protein L35 n=1 Tax=Ostreococcus tauri TaxID=70448 RepID=A0A090LXL7_OSTTA|nr:Ribosomal protein L35 [Ostreococcus tauri]OUS42745.1 hypothetical protein BE221DRAFT_187469 [Ostreococcus tauri]CEF96630.1 Ribosomal protein L35 [Ostreococcus tauri]|eukprot:XP_003074289.2 Ribosomal protein L35 [Ostreococcus tauri]
MRRALARVLHRATTTSTTTTSTSCASASARAFAPRAPRATTMWSSPRTLATRSASTSTSFASTPSRAAWTSTTTPRSISMRFRTYAKKIAVKKGTGKTSTKIKSYSSYRFRFKMSGSGRKIMRKQKGKRHCAFAKTPKRRRMLRKTTTVDATLVQPMKKLGFS